MTNMKHSKVEQEKDGQEINVEYFLEDEILEIIMDVIIEENLEALKELAK